MSPLKKLSFLLLLLLLSGCAQLSLYREKVLYPKIKNPAVVVKLSETPDQILVSSDGSLIFRCIFQEGKAVTYFSSSPINLSLSGNGIAIAERGRESFEKNLSKIYFEPKNKGFWIALNGKKYRGVLEVTFIPQRKSMLVLNIINVEDYLKGVIPAEIGRKNSGDKEAVKAQILAARTYALSHLGQYTEDGYDLVATVQDQIYNGLEDEDPLINKLIDKTKGQVITYQGKLIRAYYYANCGGKTENIEEVWDKPREDYLIGVDDDENCSWGKNFSWEQSWTKEQLEQRLVSFLKEIDTIYHYNRDSINLYDLQIMEKTFSGRIKILKAVTDQGEFNIYKDRIRWFLRITSNGNSILPSTKFELMVEKDENGLLTKAFAKGFGNGHGVGMCQIGAIGMSRKKISYDKIIKHYYPGVKLAKFY
jgi:stage II sporulation protein D